MTMKILIEVEETQADFMLDLLSKFDFVKVDSNAEEISEEEQLFIESRLQHHQKNKGKAILWDDLKIQLEKTL
jgi:hypothetical protein